MNLNRLIKGAALALVVSMLAGIELSHACSRVLWVRSGQPVLVGRTMDWFEPMETNLWTLPRGIKPRQAAPERAAARTRNLKEGLSERRFI